MRRYASNAKSILNNGPTFQCVIWNPKTKINVTIDVLIDTGGLFTTIESKLAQELGLEVTGKQGLRSYDGFDQVKDKYKIEVSFGTDNSKRIPIEAVCVEVTDEDEKVVIGRDFLTHCNLYYLGSKNQCYLEV